MRLPTEPRDLLLGQVQLVVVMNVRCLGDVATIGEVAVGEGVHRHDGRDHDGGEAQRHAVAHQQNVLGGCGQDLGRTIGYEA